MAEAGSVELGLSVEVSRCAGLLAAVQEAQQLHRDGRAALGSAHKLGPHPYVTVALLPAGLLTHTLPTLQTPFQAQTFHPTYNFKKSMSLLANPAVLGAIVAEEMCVEVWHHCPRSQTVVSALSEGRSMTRGSTLQRNVFLGSARTSMVHLLTKPQGVGGWLVLKSQRCQAVGAVQVSVQLTSTNGKPVPPGVPPIRLCPQLLDLLEPKVRGRLSAACVGHGFNGQWGQCSVHIQEATLPTSRHGHDKRPPGGPHFVAYRLPGNTGEERTGSAFPSSSPSHASLGPANAWHVKWDHCGMHTVRVDQELAESLLCYSLVVAVFRRDAVPTKRQASGFCNNVLVGRAEVDLSPLLLDRNVGDGTPQRWLSGTYPLVNPCAKHLGNAKLRIRILLDLRKANNSRFSGAVSPVGGCAWKPRRMSGKRADSISPEPVMPGRTSPAPSSERSLDSMSRCPGRRFPSRIPASSSPEPRPDGGNLPRHHQSGSVKIPALSSPKPSSNASSHGNSGHRPLHNGIDTACRGSASNPSEKRVLSLDWSPRQEPGEEPASARERRGHAQRTLSSSVQTMDYVYNPKGEGNGNTKSHAARIAALRGQRWVEGAGNAVRPDSGKGTSGSRSLRGAGGVGHVQGRSAFEPEGGHLKPKGLKNVNKGSGVGERACGGNESGNSSKPSLQQLRESVAGPGSTLSKKRMDGSSAGLLTKQRAREPLRTCSDDENFVVLGGVSASDTSSSADIPVGVFTGPGSDSEDAQPRGGNEAAADSVLVPSAKPFEYDQDWMFSISSTGPPAPSNVDPNGAVAAPETASGTSFHGSKAATALGVAGVPPASTAPAQKHGGVQQSVQPLHQATASRVPPNGVSSGQMLPHWLGPEGRTGSDRGVLGKADSSASLRSSDDMSRSEQCGSPCSSGGCLEATVSGWRGLDAVCGSVGGSSSDDDLPGGAARDRRQLNSVGSSMTQDTAIDFVAPRMAESLAKGEDGGDVDGAAHSKSLAVQICVEEGRGNRLELGGIQSGPGPKVEGKTRDPGESWATNGRGRDAESVSVNESPALQPRTKADKPLDVLDKGNRSLDTMVDSSKQVGRLSAQSSSSNRPAAGEVTGDIEKKFGGKKNVGVDDESDVRIERVVRNPTVDRKQGTAAEISFSNKLPPPPDDAPVAHAKGGGKPGSCSGPGGSLASSQVGVSADGPSTTKLFQQKRRSRSKPPLPTRSGSTSMDSDTSLFDSTLDSGVNSATLHHSAPGNQIWKRRAPEVASVTPIAPGAVAVPMLGLNFYQSSTPPGVLDPIVPLPTPVSIGLLANSPLKDFSSRALGTLAPTLASSDQGPGPVGSIRAVPDEGAAEVSGPTGVTLSGGLPKPSSQRSTAQSILQHLQLTTKGQGLASSPSVPGAGGLGGVTLAQPVPATAPSSAGASLHILGGTSLMQQSLLLGSGPLPGVAAFKGGDPDPGCSGLQGAVGRNGLQGTIFNQPGGLAFPWLSAEPEHRPADASALGPGQSSTSSACGMQSTLPGAAHRSKAGAGDDQEFQFPSLAAIHCSCPPALNGRSPFSLPPSPLVNSQMQSRDIASRQEPALGPLQVDGTGQGALPGGYRVPRQANRWRALMSEEDAVGSALALGIADGKPGEGSLEQDGQASQGASTVSEALVQTAAAPAGGAPLGVAAHGGGGLGTSVAGVTEEDPPSVDQVAETAKAGANRQPAALEGAGMGAAVGQAGVASAIVSATGPAACARPSEPHRVSVVAGADDGGGGRRREGLAGAGVGRRKYTDDETARIAKIMSSKLGDS